MELLVSVIFKYENDERPSPFYRRKKVGMSDKHLSDFLNIIVESESCHLFVSEISKLKELPPPRLKILIKGFHNSAFNELEKASDLEVRNRLIFLAAHHFLQTAGESSHQKKFTVEEVMNLLGDPKLHHDALLNEINQVITRPALNSKSRFPRMFQRRNAFKRDIDQFMKTINYNAESSAYRSGYERIDEIDVISMS